MSMIPTGAVHAVSEPVRGRGTGVLRVVSEPVRGVENCTRTQYSRNDGAVPETIPGATHDANAADDLDTTPPRGLVCGTMELLIVLNILLLLFLIGTYLSLSGRVKHLEEAIKRQFRETKDPAEGISGREEPASGVGDQAGEERSLEAEAGEEQTETAPLQPAPVPVLAEGVPRPTGMARMLRPRSREEWEILVGGKLLNRVGALALILGVGFFLKYAFDNDWLNELARVLMGAAAGLLLIGGGYRFHQRNLAVFSQGLTGAGAAILYLSIYAAYDFYHLVPQPLAFILMAVVTVAALLLSLHYDARAIALLGWAGGFLTPFLLVTAELNTIGLFVYVTLLDAGLIAILLKRRNWRLLEPLGIAATYGTFLLWSFRADLPEGLAIALVFLTLWWALFVGMSLYRSTTGDQARSAWRWATVSINAIGYYGMLVGLTRYTEGIWAFFGIEFLNPQNAWLYAAGIVAAVLSLVYFALTAWIVRRTDDRHAAAIHATAAVLLAVIVPLRFFTSYGVIITWGLEAFALFGFGVHFGRRAVRHAGTVLFAISAVGIFLFGGAYVSNLVSGYVPVLSLRTGAYWVVGGALLACTSLMQGRTESKGDLRLGMVFHVAWTFLLVAWGTVEVLHYFQYRIITLEGGSPEQLANLRQLAVSGVWLLGATLVMIMGRWLDIRALRAAAIVYFGCTVLKVFIIDLMFLDTLYRIFAFLGLSAILIAVSYLYYRNRPVS